MTDDLTRQFATRQLDMATADLHRDAERLAQAARQYADDLARGMTGGAFRLAQDATQLAMAERHLAGMRMIADMITEDPR